MNRSVLLLILVLLFALTTGCAENPVSHQSNFVVISEADEIKIGQEADLMIKERFGVYNDPLLAGYVDNVGQKIADVCDRPQLGYSFTILDTEMANAFALPGGYVYITRGLLADINSESELANVLAHEITHIAARHSVQQISQQYGYQLAWISAGILLQQQDLNRWKELADLGVQLTLLGYSREHEYESDTMGMTYAYKAGYDPKGMGSFLGTLHEHEDAEKTPPEWLSTHPSTGERIKRLQEEAQKIVDAPRTTPLIVAADIYKSRINGIKVGPNDSGGMINGRQYRNQYYGFRITAPRDWELDHNDPLSLIKFTPPRDAHTMVFVQATVLTTTLSVTAWKDKVEQGLSPRQKKLSERSLNDPLGMYSVLYEGIHDSKTYVERRDYMVDGRMGYVLTYLTPKEREQTNADAFTEIQRSFSMLSPEERQKSYSQYLIVYTVKEGETIDTVALMFAPIKAEDILVFNGLPKGAVLYPGEQLKIPPKKIERVSS